MEKESEERASKAKYDELVAAQAKADAEDRYVRLSIDTIKRGSPFLSSSPEPQATNVLASQDSEKVQDENAIAIKALIGVVGNMAKDMSGLKQSVQLLVQSRSNSRISRTSHSQHTTPIASKPSTPASKAQSVYSPMLIQSSPRDYTPVTGMPAKRPPHRDSIYAGEGVNIRQYQARQSGEFIEPYDTSPLNYPTVPPVSKEQLAMIKKSITHLPRISTIPAASNSSTPASAFHPLVPAPVSKPATPMLAAPHPVVPGIHKSTAAPVMPASMAGSFTYPPYPPIPPSVYPSAFPTGFGPTPTLPATAPVPPLPPARPVPVVPPVAPTPFMSPPPFTMHGYPPPGHPGYPPHTPYTSGYGYGPPGYVHTHPGAFPAPSYVPTPVAPPPATAPTVATTVKRISIMDKITSAIENPMHGCFMMQTLPDYSKIVLNTLTIDSVIKFIDAVHDYTAEHSVAFKLTSRVSEGVRGTILSRNRVRLHNVEFNSLTNSELVTVLRTTIQPRSINEFVETMKTCVKFRMSSDACPANFEAFYDALSRYKRKWMLYYDIMAADNEENVPHCNTQKNGAIYLFTDPIPKGYGKNRANTLHNKKHTDVIDFIEAFWIEVEKDYQKSKGYKTMELGFDRTDCSEDDSNSDSGKKHSHWSRKKSDGRENDSRVRLHNMPGPAQDSDDDADKQQFGDFIAHESDDAKSDPPNKISREAEKDRRQEPAVAPKEGNGGLNAIDATPRPQDKYQPKSILKGPDRSNQPTQRPRTPESEKLRKYGCLAMIKDGKCDKGNLCKWSHEESDLRETWRRMKETVALRESRYGGPNKPERKSGSDSDHSSD